MREGCQEVLRLGAAVVFLLVVGGVALAFGARVGLSPWLALPAWLLLLMLAVFAFNRGALRKLRGISFEDELRAQEARGKVVREHVVATRCLHFEDAGTGCDAYLLEVAGGGVLCLYGQYGFEPIEENPDDGEPASPRDFPRDTFDLLRKRANGYLLHVEMTGAVFEPEHVDPELDALYALGIDLDDGKRYPDLDYDAVRAVALRSRPRTVT